MAKKSCDRIAEARNKLNRAHLRFCIVLTIALWVFMVLQRIAITHLNRDIEIERANAIF